MVSQSSSVGYTIMGKTADLTVVQKTTIDTLHKEGKTQKVIAKEAGCSQSSVSKHINREAKGRKRCGRKKCTSNRDNRILHFLWKSGSQSLEEERRGTESTLLEVQCKVSTVSDGLGCHVICWCWSTVFSEVQGQHSRIPGSFRALHASCCWPTLWRCRFHFPTGLGTCTQCQSYQYLV